VFIELFLKSIEVFIEDIRACCEVITLGLKFASWLFREADTPEAPLILGACGCIPSPVLSIELCIEIRVSFKKPALELWLIDGLMSEALLVLFP